MADTNVSKLFASLFKMRDNVISLMETTEDLSKAASVYNGEISRVLPLNLKSVLGKLSTILEGSGQDSITSLIDFLDAVPLSDVREKPISERRLDASAMADDIPARPAISTAPDLSRGPQSAVMKESRDLSAYYKDAYRENNSNEKRLHERGAVSFRDILSDPTLGVDLEESPDVVRSAGIPDEVLSKVSPHAHDFDDDNEFNDGEETFVDEGTGERMDTSPADISDWRSIARQTNGPSHEDLASMLHGAEGVRELCSR